MNAILGMIDMALPKATEPFVQDCLQTAKSSADLLLTLLNDLLDSAKIESGKLELESAPFSLRRMLDQIARVLSARASEKGLRFDCRMPESTPDAVLGDRVRLQQVLLNLTGNAVKFTQRGEVEVSVRCLARDDRDACLVFSVRDTGIGIQPSDLERLFQPFTQGDPSMARRFGGTGLGLSISKSLVQMMGGQIRVESEPGAGTTFSFDIRLPLTKGLPASGDVPGHVPAAVCAPLRILLVEDNPANQKVAHYILQGRGHAVEIAGDGQEAVCLAEQVRYDVILMDVQMPEMNGLEATAAIRAREYAGGENGGRRVPIVAMTAHAMQGDRDRCLAAGMDGYLCKPVQREELIEAVERLANRGLGRREERFGTSDEGLGVSDQPDRRDGGFEGDNRVVADPRHLVSDPSLLIPDSAPFNLDDALARLDGNLGLFREMAGYFFSDAGKLLPEIQAAAAAGDATAMERNAHRLKGTLLYLGAEAAVKTVARVETAGRSGNLADADAAIRSMEEEVTRLAAALRPYGPEG
jgi:CheY-like chemotaxis protein/HPt (histidine-containing phosphotransfer) domain-containing protein